MKRIFIFCSLYFIVLSVFAETCPPPEPGYIFRVAAWGNHVASTSQVRCHYYYRTNENVHYQYNTPALYTEDEIRSYWGYQGDLYYLCVSQNTDVNDCRFSHF